MSKTMSKTLRWKFLLCAAVMVPASTLDTVRSFAQALPVEQPVNKQGTSSVQNFETQIVGKPFKGKISSKHGEDPEEALRSALEDTETSSTSSTHLASSTRNTKRDTRNVAKLDVKTDRGAGLDNSGQNGNEPNGNRNLQKTNPEIKSDVKLEAEVSKVEVIKPQKSPKVVPEQVAEKAPEKVAEKAPEKVTEIHQVASSKTLSEEAPDKKVPDKKIEKKLASKQAPSALERALNVHALVPAALVAEKEQKQRVEKSQEHAQNRIQVSHESVSKSTTQHVEDELVLQVGMGRMILLKQNVSRLFSADSNLVVVHSAGPRSFFVFGLKPGNTVIEAVSPSGERVARYAVKVTPSQYQTSVLKNGVAAKSPHVRVEPLPDGVALEGEAPNPEAAQKIIDRTRSMVGANGYVADYMKVPGSIQVNLHVRILEMDRSLVRDFGINWQSVNTLGNMALIGVLTEGVGSIAIAENANKLSTVFTALATDGLVRNLAEPNLTTISGQPASFLVGGEFPVPISNYTGTPMISFKPYGIQLEFVPTVLANGQISLHVRPSVSALDYSTGGYTVKSMNTNSSMVIPGITMRRADTTVELGSGQSFVIAGLLQDVASMDTSGMPWLKNIPILGSLFKSSNFKDNMSELVIIVTPYLVKPVNNERELHTPDEDWRPPRGVDQVFLMHQSQTDVSKRQPWQKVDVNNVGFIME
ncbi:MAG: pilus assembly protein N-terminal domain-containing protein [Acetobacter sp.]|nr:pilus assembly protein N-terminal domain-containing protein [Acetobacter sp.]